ncbi:MAG: PP2C family protein-serine/threonine phosphatase [Acidobacteriaceae bacterium]
MRRGVLFAVLVALLVGAIRTVAGFSRDPETMLRELNQRLLGRGDAQATCLALLIAADGRATLANAGHLPPYRNGKPMGVEGSLPLGVLEEPEFTLLRFTLAEEDRLMLLSDGIAEAKDAAGRLFGFERVLDLVRTSRSAEDIAAEAQRFGQEDDISVIAVTRMAMGEPLPA